MSTISYALLGNVIATLALVGTTFFELYWNPRRRALEEKKGADPLDALQRSKTRASRFAVIAFVALVISSITLIGDAMSSEEKDQHLQAKIQVLEAQGKDYAGRLRKIEDTIWPPSPPGKYPIGPQPVPPYDPAGIAATLDNIKKQLEDISAKGHVTDSRLDRLIRIVDELTTAVQQHEREMETVKQAMGAPAGSAR